MILFQVAEIILRNICIILDFISFFLIIGEPLIGVESDLSVQEFFRLHLVRAENPWKSMNIIASHYTSLQSLRCLGCHLIGDCPLHGYPPRGYPPNKLVLVAKPAKVWSLWYDYILQCCWSVPAPFCAWADLLGARVLPFWPFCRARLRRRFLKQLWRVDKLDKKLF